MSTSDLEELYAVATNSLQRGIDPKTLDLSKEVEPQLGRSERASEYYNHFSAKAPIPVSQSFESEASSGKHSRAKKCILILSVLLCISVFLLITVSAFAVLVLSNMEIKEVPLILLVGGDNPNKGNVYAYNSRLKFFGPVCDDGWTMTNANVVCKEMGYTGARNLTVGSFFGNATERFAFDNVICTGTEKHLEECYFEDEKDDCGQNKGAGVICLARR